MELPQPVINDGFGPQLTGDVTIAQIFDGEVDLHITEHLQRQQAVRGNIPEKLKEELMAFKTKVNDDTPMAKFDMLMRWLEQRTADATLKMQIRTKAMKAMLKGDAELEESFKETGTLGPNSSIPKSSLLGRDPFGDRPLPEECYKKKRKIFAASADSATEVDEEVQVSESLSSTATRTSTGEEARAEDLETQEGSQTTPAAKKEYSTVGLLVKDLQETNRQFITVMIYYLLDEDITVMCREREGEYRNNPQMLKQTPRGAMPWSEYKDLIRGRLMETVGWKELGDLEKTRRKPAQKMTAWLHTLAQGKRVVESHGHILHDKAYINKAIRDTDPIEWEKVVARYAETKGPTYKAVKAKIDLKKETWETFRQVAKTALANSTYVFRGVNRRKEKKRKAEPVKGGKAKGKDKSGNPRKKPKTKGDKSGKSEDTQEQQHCKKCAKAGLTWRCKTHKTEDCDDERRIAAVKSMKKRKKAYQERRERAGKARRERKTGKGCGHCKKNKRPYLNHEEKDCLYTTVWKGLVGDALKKAQKNTSKRIERNTPRRW